MTTPSCAAFDGMTKIAQGSRVSVALIIKAHLAAKPDCPVLIFDDETGRQFDMNLSGTDEEVASRLIAPAEARSAGRPKLGVVPKEVTLLPRHWEWLSGQSGGASVTLRKLVEEALRRDDKGALEARKARERAYAFMSAIAGDLPNFEEASRALFAPDPRLFRVLIKDWPEDVGGHILRLAAA